MSYQFDIVTFIGRFQPFHSGHKSVVDRALGVSEQVNLVVGCYGEPRSPRNPFTFDERVEMVKSCYPDLVSAGRLHFTAQVDHTYNDARWISDIQKSVDTLAKAREDLRHPRVGLIGHSKDHTSYYLRSFPNWESVEVENYQDINATQLRSHIFGGRVEKLKVPDAVSLWIQRWVRDQSQVFQSVAEEHQYVRAYKKQWESAPYPPTFVTTGALVVQSGHILMVRRRSKPGKGLLALPGGFLTQDETLIDCAIAQLKQETQIGIHPIDLKRSMNKTRIFDDPHRSQRGRTLAVAFLFELQNRLKLPKVKGSDEAEQVSWVPLGRLKRSECFEDHYCIIEEMVQI